VWSGKQDERLAIRAQTLLEDFGIDAVEICIDEVAGALPCCQADETYQLEYQCASESTRAKITAPNTWGALHGLTTLWQLCASAADTTNADQHFNVHDFPRFAWRGLLIDVARHFFSLDLLKRIVDGMSRLKMNVLHLHLTDDQAFRFASAKFPKLASCECYSQDELAELVQYAANVGVRIVPELDVPGHVTSWLCAYPQWGVEEVLPSEKFGVHKACLNPIEESVYAMLDDLLEEVCTVFPDEYVHIGGDEVHPEWWRTDDKIQAYIAEHGHGDVRGLQAYFNRRVYACLTARGRKVIGWDEVLHENMPPMVVQNWRGATTRDRALARGLDCVVSAGYYLDLSYPADIHYGWDPQAPQDVLVSAEDELKQDLRLAHVAAGIAWTDQWRQEAINIDAVGPTICGEVLGGEACLWTELVDEQSLETRLWSRLPAVAERLWSAHEITDTDDFYARLNGLLNTPFFNLVKRQHEALLALGLNPVQADIAMLLEPIKWYARLLGEQALNARLMGQEMPQARPYDVTTPLNRVVDMIAPESLSARALCDMPDKELLALMKLWQEQDAAAWPVDLRGAIGGLKQAANIMIDALEHDVANAQSDLLALYIPYGEYMLAPVLVLVDWLARAK